MRPISTRSLLAPLLAAAIILVIALVAASTRKSKELPVYVKGAERLIAGEQIYRYEPKAFTYPPFFAVPFTLLVPFPEFAQRVLWWTANLGTLIAIVWLVWSLIEPTLPADRRKRWIFAGLLGLLSAKFVFSPLGHESHDLIVLLMVVLSARFACRKQQAAAGVFAGIAAACKATPLLLLPYFLWRRMPVASVAMVAAAAVATILPDVISSNPDGKLWVKSWQERFVAKVDIAESPDVEGAWARWNAMNQSLVGTAHRWFHPVKTEGKRINVCMFRLSESALRNVTLAAQVLVLLTIAFATWPRRDPAADAIHLQKQTLAHYGALVCGMLLLSPMSSPPHFCALLLPLAVLAGEVVRRPRHPIVLAGLAGTLLLGAFSAKDLLGRNLANGLQAFGGTMLCTIVCLAVSAWISREKSRVPQADPETLWIGKPRRRTERAMVRS